MIVISDVQEYSMKHMDAEYPTKTCLWLYSASSYDALVFSNGEKIDLVTREGIAGNPFTLQCCFSHRQR